MPKINTFEDAVKAAIQHYWDTENDDTPELSKVKPRKYTKKYFDQVQQDTTPDKKIKDVKPSNNKG